MSGVRIGGARKGEHNAARGRAARGEGRLPVPVLQEGGGRGGVRKKGTLL